MHLPLPLPFTKVDVSRRCIANHLCQFASVLVYSFLKCRVRHTFGNGRTDERTNGQIEHNIMLSQKKVILVDKKNPTGGRGPAKSKMRDPLDILPTDSAVGNPNRIYTAFHVNNY